MELHTGDVAPAFTLPSHEGKPISLADYRGKRVIVYFYPKDNTPGCTKESCDFSHAFTAFATLNTVVLGISKDSVAKHKNFHEKHAFSFLLLSDENNTTCENYDVWKQKSMFGKKYRGIERTTFLIDAAGKIEYVWKKVSVLGHVKAVEKYLAAHTG